jgi:hypothetical protein
VVAGVVAVAPGLAFGVGGQVHAVRYPAGWARAAQAVAGTSGDVAVLPAGMFRRFDFSGPAPVLDPAPRMLPHPVLQTGDLIVAAKTVSGEGARARAAEQALLHGDPPQRLARLGVGAVLVEAGTPGPTGDSARTLAALTLRWRGDGLTVYAVPGVRHVAGTSAWRVAIVVAAHLVWAGMLLAGIGWWVGGIRVSAVQRRVGTTRRQ